MTRRYAFEDSYINDRTNEKTVSFRKRHPFLTAFICAVLGLAVGTAPYLIF